MARRRRRNRRPQGAARTAGRGPGQGPGPGGGPGESRRPGPPGHLVAALVLSGAASLLHEVTWNRTWVLVFGSSLGATSVVLAIFMAGLGLGARRVEGAGRLLRARGAALYARLELLVAAHALAAPWLLAAADHLHLAAARMAGPGSPWLVALRILIAILLLLPASMAMGATLPALCQEVPPDDDAERALGTLYAANTAGAVLGVVLGSYWWIPGFGLQATGWIAALASVWAAALVGAGEEGQREAAPGGAPPQALGDIEGPAGTSTDEVGFEPSARTASDAQDPGETPEDPGTPPQTSTDRAPSAGAVLAVYAFVGFWGMAFEVLFARVVLAAAGASTYAFAAMLGAFLTGLAGGSAAASRWALAGRDPWRALARRLGLTGGLVALSALALPAYGQVYLKVFPLVSGFFGGELATWALGVAFLLPAGFGLGTLFPAAAAALLETGAPAEAVGRAYQANSLAGAAGALAAYLVLAPVAGVRGALLAGAVSMLAASAWLDRGPRGVDPDVARASRLRRRALIAGACLALVTAHARAPFGLTRTAYRWANERPEQGVTHAAWDLSRDQVLWYRDGPDASVAVTRHVNDGVENLALRIQGKADGSLTSDLQVQTMLGTMPALLHPRGGAGSEVLMVGLGTGASAHAALLHPVAAVDVLELSPTVAEASRAAFAPHFPNAFHDPRARLHLGDARLWIRAWPRPVAAIASEPTNLFVQGVANLFTREFFSACRQRLEPGGVLVQWLQRYDVDAGSLAAMILTLDEAFPHYALFWFTDLFFVASDRPIQLDAGVVAAALQRPQVRAAVEAAGLPPTPEGIARRFVAGDPALRAWAASVSGAEVLTDDRPALEFRTAAARFGATFPSLARAIGEVRSRPEHERALPLTGLLRPLGPASSPPVGFAAAGLELGPGVGGEARLLRLREDDPRVVGAFVSAPLLPVWSRQDEDARVQLQAWPAERAPDPAATLSQVIRAAVQAGAPAPAREATEVHGHPAQQARFEGSGALPSHLMVTWTCSVTGRTYVASIGANQRGREPEIWRRLGAQVRCAHGPQGGAGGRLASEREPSLEG